MRETKKYMHSIFFPPYSTKHINIKLPGKFFYLGHIFGEVERGGGRGTQFSGLYKEIKHLGDVSDVPMSTNTSSWLLLGLTATSVNPTQPYKQHGSVTYYTETEKDLTMRGGQRGGKPLLYVTCTHPTDVCTSSLLNRKYCMQTINTKIRDLPELSPLW